MSNPKECDILRKATPQLESAIRETITPLCAKLLARGLIDRDQRIKLRNTARDKVERAADLVDIIAGKVEQDPKNFYTFIEVLQESGDTYAEVLQRMKPDEKEKKMEGCQMQQPNSRHLPPASHEDIEDPFSEIPELCAPVQWTFPYLKDAATADMEDEGYEDLKTRLYLESQAIMEKFSYMFTSFFESLCDQKVPIIKIVANLESFGAFTPIHSSKNQPLLTDKLEDLDLGPNSDEDIMYSKIQRIVTKYCSFFNYKLLSFLVSKHGTPDDQGELKQYEIAFAEYAKRRVLECPSEIAEMNKKDATLIVKIDTSYQRSTLNQIKMLQGKMCDIIGVSDLKLICIKRGCLQLTFQLPVFVQKAIFPLSTDQQDNLKSLGILRLDCEDYHFTLEGDNNNGRLQNDNMTEPVGAQCVDCRSDEGAVAILCKTHFICPSCLEGRALNQRENVLKCTECLATTTKQKSAQVSSTLSFKDALLKPKTKVPSTMTTPPPTKQTEKKLSKERCWIFVHDSNIWITAKRLQGQRKKFKTSEDHRVRIDMGKLGDVLADGRTIVEGTLYGSEPPYIDTVWKKIEEKKWKVEKFNRDEVSGKELVHTQLVADVVEVALTTPEEQRSTIILVTGDANIVPAIEEILDNDDRWKIEIYMWKSAIARKLYQTEAKYDGRLIIKQLDDNIDHVTFTSMEFNTSDQEFSTTVRDNGVVFVMESDAFPNQAPTLDWVRKLEDLAKWPFQYYWLKEEGGKKTNNLVVVFRRDKKSGESFDIASFLKKLVTTSQSATQHPYRIPKVSRAITFKEFEKEKEELKTETEEETKLQYYFEQIGVFTIEQIFQGFHNNCVHVIEKYKPESVYSAMVPLLDWIYKYPSAQFP